MEREPLITIGAVVTSVKLAVVAVVGVIVIAAELPEELGSSLILAAGLIVVAVGDVLQLVLTRPRVTPAARPTLPEDGAVRLPGGTAATVTSVK